MRTERKIALLVLALLTLLLAVGLAARAGELGECEALEIKYHKVMQTKRGWTTDHEHYAVSDWVPFPEDGKVAGLTTSGTFILDEPFKIGNGVYKYTIKVTRVVDIPDCEVEQSTTTTTLVEETTTTVEEETTTTVVEETTTTEAPEESTTTAPPPPSSEPPAEEPEEEELPFTGLNSGWLAVLAGGLVTLGAVGLRRARSLEG